MRRTLVLGFVFVTLGCRAAAERAVLQPLPDDTAPLPYRELLSRARLQAMTANEAFYVGRWPDVEDAARGLEQTARFLKVYEEYKKAPDVTRKRIFLETMERVMGDTDKVIIDSKGGQGVVPYLPLDQLQQRRPQPTEGGN